MNDHIVSVWEKHLEAELFSKDVDATMATMVEEPSLFVLPTLKGGHGAAKVRDFYQNDFTPGLPEDIAATTASRQIGSDFLVEELIMTFTHSVEMPWMLPGVAPTGRPVKIPVLGLVKFAGDKLAYEHVWWDQSSLLIQVGALEALPHLPMHGLAGAEAFEAFALEDIAGS